MSDKLPSTCSEHGDLVQVGRVEIDAAISTAKAYPRDVRACATELRELVTMDLDTAESCLYSLPRDGKAITGPSVRLAEMAVSCWGNIKAGWRVVEIGERWVEVEAVAHDLQKNTMMQATAKRSIWGKHGRYGENMIQTTIMAAGAIAFRNAVFKVIPAALVKGALDASRQAVLDGVGDYQARIPAMVQFFADSGVTERAICRYFAVDKVEDIGAEAFLQLLGISKSIKAGDALASDFFGRSIKRQPVDGMSLQDLDDGHEGGAE